MKKIITFLALFGAFFLQSFSQTHLDGTQFKSNFEAEAAAIFTVNNISGAYVTDIEYENGLKISYNTNGLNEVVHPFVEIEFANQVDFTGDAFYIITFSNDHNFKNEQGNKSTTPFLLELVDAQSNVVSESVRLSTTNTINEPVTVYGVFSALNEKSLADVAKIRISDDIPNNGWGDGNLTIHSMNIGRSQSAQAASYRKYDFSEQTVRDNSLLFLNQGAAINQAKTDALYIDYANFGSNAEFCSFILEEPLDMSGSAAFSMKANFGNNITFNINFFDGNNNEISLNTFYGNDSESDFWYEKAAEQGTFDYSDIRRVRFYRPWEWEGESFTGEMKISEITLGAYGKAPEQEATYFIYDFDGSRLYHNDVFTHNLNTNNNNSTFLRTDGQLNINMNNNGGWNYIYYGIILNEPVDISAYPQIIIDLNTSDFIFTEDNIVFFIKDADGAEVDVEKSRPNGKITIDFTGKNIDLTKIKEFKMTGSTWGTSNLGAFSVSYLQMGKKPVTATWIGSNGANLTQWNEASNWEGGIKPSFPIDNVIIKGKGNANSEDNALSFPVLSDNITVNSITFEPGAELGGQNYLTAIEGATVQFDFTNTARWHILTMPVSGITTGKFNFKEDVNDTDNPYSWLMKFEPKEDVNDNNKTIAHWALKGDNEDLSIGEGFAVSIGDIVNEQVIGWTSEIKSVALTGNLWKDGGNTVFETGVLDFGAEEDSHFALVGNPFMTSIDFDELYLYSDNSDKIKNDYLVWTEIVGGNGPEEGFVGFTSIGDFGIAGASEYIAPMQAFFVEKENNAGDNITLSFDLASMGAIGEGSLRAATSDDYGKLDIVAENGTVPVKAFITNKEDMESARKLMDGCRSIPDIYTLAENKTGAFGAQVIDTDDKITTIPIGIATGTSGSMSLIFSGMSSYGSDMNIELFDTVEDESIPLVGSDPFKYDFNYTPPTNGGNAIADESRFYLVFTPSSMLSVNDVAKTALSVYAKNNIIHVVSTSTDPIREIAVYDMQGRMICRENNLNTPIYMLNIPESTTDVYIVKAITKNAVKNVKVRQ